MTSKQRFPVFSTFLIFLIFIGSLNGLPNTDLNTNQCDVQDENQDKSEFAISNGYAISELTNLTTMGGVTSDIVAESGYLDGYNLFVLQQRNETTKDLLNRTLLLIDMEGNIHTQRDLTTVDRTLNSPVEFINSTTILVGDPQGAYLWNIYSNAVDNLSIQGHHEYEYNSVDDTFFTLNKSLVDIEGTLYAYDLVMEYNRTGDLLWSLETQTFVQPSQWCPYSDTYLGFPDITHANSIFFDSEEDVFFLNLRNVNTFYKINHSTGDVIWGLGEFGNFTLFDINGMQKSNLFYHAHAVEQIDDRTFILFDNDRDNQTDFGNRVSRIVEITINETTMTANETWVWSSPQYEYYTGWLGDADRLANGNRLGTFGTYVHDDLDIGARLVEVSNLGDIVWEMNFPSAPGVVFDVYRMDRVRLEPILSEPMDLQAPTNDNITLSWDAWYNFRPKRNINGTYSLYINEVLNETGVHTFDKFWRPSQLEFQFGHFPVGLHNFTLELMDEAGHSTSDTVVVLVSDFFIERTGQVEIEKGESNSVMEWFGDTASLLNCTIRIDSAIHSEFEWVGDNITLDMNTLDVGSHFVNMTLVNFTQTTYIETFWILVHPNELPQFVAENQDLTIHWNQTEVLSWDIFDNSPYLWTIAVNGTYVETGNWISKNYLIQWNVLPLDEGIYNITLIIVDRVGNIALSTSMLEITVPPTPIISGTPSNTIVTWGDKVAFEWEVHGGTHWELWRNGTSVSDGYIFGNSIIHEIQSWQNERWTIGVYNLTLKVANESLSSVTATIWIQVIFDMGDPYADQVIGDRSEWYLFGDNAIAAPDNNYAIIFLDYGNGYLTLDMGFQEEIIDGEGDDFSIIARGGNYTLYVGESTDILFTRLGYSSGNDSFDISESGFETVRFVRIEYRDGVDVEIDAIVALNFNAPEGDTEAPVIEDLVDFWVWENQTSIPLSWTASDATPWSYEIQINNTQVASGQWNGSDIEYVFEPVSSGRWNVTLVLSDVFGNQGFDTVLIEIRTQSSTIPTTITTTTTTSPDTTLFAITILISGAIGISIASLVIFTHIRKERMVGN